MEKNKIAWLFQKDLSKYRVFNASENLIKKNNPRKKELANKWLLVIENFHKVILNSADVCSKLSSDEFLYWIDKFLCKVKFLNQWEYKNIKTLVAFANKFYPNLGYSLSKYPKFIKPKVINYFKSSKSKKSNFSWPSLQNRVHFYH